MATVIEISVKDQGAAAAREARDARTTQHSRRRPRGCCCVIRNPGTTDATSRARTPQDGIGEFRYLCEEVMDVHLPITISKENPRTTCSTPTSSFSQQGLE
ncbi:hypothetical protein ColKHC_08416 [Colletotrichum higginsianum]|nr:hypothetical protein ColKHC_08416 [Colletotrichum higginsianum]